jgi:hypothetical protein
VGTTSKYRKIVAFEEQTTIPEIAKSTGAEMAHPSSDPPFGSISAVTTLSPIYTAGTFIKAGIQARKHIQLLVTAQEVQEGSNLLPMSFLSPWPHLYNVPTITQVHNSPFSKHVFVSHL